MDIFSLSAKIKLDDEGFTSGLKKAGEKFGSFASGVGRVAGVVTKASAAAVGAGAIAIGGLVKQSVDAYGKYEQLVGGMETLFKDSSDEIIGYASEAYKTAGMSSNQYMETATQFSASLLKSLGGDTAKAAKYADKAIRQMSDNVNKMGTDVEMVQNAYRGFARGNFTMLDNLSLGYAGTKTGMEELLTKAEELSAAQGEYRDFSIDSYADIVDAIGLVQDEMGITGTTAKEAADTIQGSAGSMKAAWENLVTGLGDSNADLDTLVGEFIDSAAGMAGNIAPVVETALKGIGKAIEEYSPELIGAIPKVIEDMLPGLLSAASSLVSSLVEAIPEGLNTITTMLTENEDGIAGIINGATDFILEQTPLIMDAGLNLFSALLDDLPGIVSNLTAKLPEFIDRLLGTGQYEGQGLLSHIPDILDAGVDLLGSLLDNLPAIMDSLSQGISQFVTELCDWLTDPENIKKLMGVGWKFTQAIVQGMGNIIDNAGNWIAEEVFGIDNESDKAFDLGQVMTDIKNGVDPEVAFARGNQRREYHDKAFDAIFSGDENAALYYMSGGREWIGQRPGAVVEVNNYGVSPNEVTDEVTKALNKTGVYAQ